MSIQGERPPPRPCPGAIAARIGACSDGAGPAQASFFSHGTRRRGRMCGPETGLFFSCSPIAPGVSGGVRYQRTRKSLPGFKAARLFSPSCPVWQVHTPQTFEPSFLKRRKGLRQPRPRRSSPLKGFHAASMDLTASPRKGLRQPRPRINHPQTLLNLVCALLA